MKKVPKNHLRQEFNNDNLHRIAISNLQDHERRIIRWWSKKYRLPVKPLEEHTMEELIVEILEDYYERQPEEIERFMANESGVLDWDGSMSDEYEKAMQKKWAKKKQVDLSALKDEKPLTEEEEKAILDNLGRNLPAAQPKKGEAVADEFEDNFQ